VVSLGDGNDYYRMIGAGEYVLYAAGDPANFAKDWVVAPPGGMESQFTAVTKHLVGLRWPFRQHTTFDSTASRVLNVLEEVNRDVAFEGTALGPRPMCETLSPKTLRARCPARRQHQYPEPHVAGRRGVPEQIRRTGGGRCAAGWRASGNGNPAGLRYRREPGDQL